MVRLAILSLVVLAHLAIPGAAMAALDFKDCDSAAQCATVRVPLDRSGGVPGTVDLHVERMANEEGAKGVLIAMAGGPGQGSTPLIGDWGNYLHFAAGIEQLVVFDQRGTGRSDVLRCKGLQRAGLDEITEQAEACAGQLGAKRAFYTAREAVQDMEAVRLALGVDKISIYGVSYGTKLALNYAAAYPTHVERLVLDSVLGPVGPDPFYRSSMAAVPRILRALCRGRCGAISDDPAGDLAAVVDRIGERGLSGTAYDGRGRPHRVQFTTGDLFTQFHVGDLFPDARKPLPAALAAAADGDTALLARLLYVPENGPSVAQPVREFSQGMFAAATCEETDMPWARTAPVGERLDQARAGAAAVSQSVFEPFDADAALASDTIRMCRRWPHAPQAPVVATGPLPDVPVLIMNGENDMRTPLSSARAVAAQFPRATVVTDRVGHSVLFSSVCAQNAVADFFADREPGKCKRAKRVGLDPLPPRSVAGLDPLGAKGLRGKTLRALEATLREIGPRLQGELLFFEGDAVRAGGLRGGWISVGQKRKTLARYTYVPRMTVSGDLTTDRLLGGEFKLGGRDAAKGTVTLRNGRLTGQLDGRPVSARIRVQHLGT